jgi:hypothetical protein
MSNDRLITEFEKMQKEVVVAPFEASAPSPRFCLKRLKTNITTVSIAGLRDET